ncbi:DNA-formamidopyrimidine glycosylase family protein [Deminuibacter soli]|uniref:Fpg/Nei family DNA glycosylase n=1 Tax=Deminuibacter soli TaxID=2291815 RepID=A0A3E1NQ98_9BACT|nr:DNA-formamidopyrimidine glycosylase family protein [Deminuibacter soli]RFM30093.1 Fpg/Nei family DNA glycosylase [Deminuibacter soli]
MPELPDLQAFSQNLHKKLSGKTLKDVKLANAKSSSSSAAAFKKTLAGLQLKKVYREGKELRFRFDKGEILGMHLMLNGKLQLDEKYQPYKSAVVELLFDDGTSLVLTDFRGLAKVSLNPAEEDVPDALSDTLTETYLQEKLGATRTPVKKVLLDQHIIRGIGNAYADEILWDARLSPFSASNKIPVGKIKTLLHSIRKVLQHAEKQILKANPDIISGELRDFLVIHQHSLTHSPTGGIIKQEEMNKRSTYFTDEQELFK